MVEATAVSPEGRISPDDSGIWSDAHGRAFERITKFISEQERSRRFSRMRAARRRPMRRGSAASRSAANRGWQPLGPSPIAFDQGIPFRGR